MRRPWRTARGPRLSKPGRACPETIGFCPALALAEDPGDPRLEPYRAVRERDLIGRHGLFVIEGRVVLEFPYACDFVEHVEFDTIYHEHVFYFTLTALQPLFARPRAWRVLDALTGCVMLALAAWLLVPAQPALP